MLVVHHLGVSQSERIVWLCEELEILYELVRYDRDPATRLAPAAYKALHPLGTAPIITDGDLVLAESGAIMDYIIARYGDFRLTERSDSSDFTQYLFWFNFANGSMMSAAMMNSIISRLGDGKENPTMQSLGARLDKGFALVEARLGAAEYLAGSRFTAADIIMLFPLTTMRAFAPRDLSPYPNIRAYLARIGARPAYRRAMAKGDPGMTPFLT
jgi:glutathione S-transferase